ncbi:MAG: hypothetical protein V2A61_07635 [Calditrichota bacterium]
MLKLFSRKPPPLRSVLFVCTANVTRSPAAAALFRAEAAKHGEIWTVASAGTKAFKGFKPHSAVAFIMDKRGIKINNHRSQRATKKLLRKYHWILVMEESHREALIKDNPKLANNIYVFRKFGLESDNQEMNMPDPTGKDNYQDPEGKPDYCELFAILDVEIPRIFKLLQLKVSDLEWAQQADDDE